jgi:type VII secretion protein EccE
VTEARYASVGPTGGAPGGWSQPTVQQPAGGGHRRSPAAGGRAQRAPSAHTRFTLTQLVLLEIAAGSVTAGIAGRHAWTAIGIAVGIVFAGLSLVPVQRRWLYQALGSRVRLAGRRGSRRRYTGLASLAGPYQIVDVATSGGAPIAVIRAGTTWALPLELRQDSVFNDDAGVPLDGLASLLEIEDVALASVRLLSLATPALVPAGAPTAPPPLLARGATRYCVLTLDTMIAAEALAARGGSDAAINQILRRCALRAEEVLGSATLRLEALDETAARRALEDCLGPAAPVGNASAAATTESANGIRVGGTYSTTVLIGGSAAVALRSVGELIPYLPGRIAATALVLTPGRHRDGSESTLLVRVSAPLDSASGQLAGQLRKALSQAGVPVQRLAGEQGELLRASTPLGLSEGMA